MLRVLSSARARPHAAISNTERTETDNFLTAPSSRSPRSRPAGSRGHPTNSPWTCQAAVRRFRAPDPGWPTVTFMVMAGRVPAIHAAKQQAFASSKGGSGPTWVAGQARPRRKLYHYQPEFGALASISSTLKGRPTFGVMISRDHRYFSQTSTDDRRRSRGE